MLSTGNGLQAFLDQMTVAKAGARTPVTEVYEGYKRWEAANGGRPVCTRNKLPSKLRAVGFTVKSSVGIDASTTLRSRPSPRRLQMTKRTDLGAPSSASLKAGFRDRLSERRAPPGPSGRSKGLG